MRAFKLIIENHCALFGSEAVVKQKPAIESPSTKRCIVLWVQVYYITALVSQLPPLHHHRIIHLLPISFILSTTSSFARNATLYDVTAVFLSKSARIIAQIVYLKSPAQAYARKKIGLCCIH